MKITNYIVLFFLILLIACESKETEIEPVENLPIEYTVFKPQGLMGEYSPVYGLVTGIYQKKYPEGHDYSGTNLKNDEALIFYSTGIIEVGVFKVIKDSLIGLTSPHTGKKVKAIEAPNYKPLEVGSFEITDVAFFRQGSPPSFIKSIKEDLIGDVLLITETEEGQDNFIAKPYKYPYVTLRIVDTRSGWGVHSVPAYNFDQPTIGTTRYLYANAEFLNGNPESWMLITLEKQ